MDEVAANALEPIPESPIEYEALAGFIIGEMETNKKLANCCGQGGMLPVHRPDIADRVAALRLEEAKETGAEILATGCSRCVAMLSGVQTDKPENLPRVVNIVDLLAAAMGL